MKNLKKVTTSKKDAKNGVSKLPPAELRIDPDSDGKRGSGIRGSQNKEGLPERKGKHQEEHKD